MESRRSTKILSSRRTEVVDATDPMAPIGDSRSYLNGIKNLCKQLSEQKNRLGAELNDLTSKLKSERSELCELIDRIPSLLSVDSSSLFVLKEKTHLSHTKTDNLNHLLTKYQELCRYYSYLCCVGRIHAINDKLEYYIKKEDWTNVSFVFEELIDLSRQLKLSKCTNLKKFVKTTKNRWKSHLKREFEEAMEQILQKHGFPQQEIIKNVEEFKAALRRMAKFSLILTNSKKSGDGGDDNFLDQFTECLLKPLRKRFVYHFADPNRYLGSSTDIIDPTTPKPEWYFSLILKWHQQFTPLLHSLLNKVNGDELPESGRSIPIDFCRGLVILARDRFKFDLTLVLDPENKKIDFDKCFPHLIDEAVAFDIELREIGYLETDVGCVELLSEPGVFERWFELEHQQCTKCIETLLADQSAWAVRYSDASDLDHFKVPRCVDRFLSLLTAITHRYRLVRSRQHRLQFVHLQRTLVDDFRMHLFQLTRSSSSPWTRPFPQIVNAASYVKLVLSQWQELPFFVDLEPGIFDELIDLFGHLRRQMLSDAKEAALEEMKPLLSMYRRDIATTRFDENAVSVLLVPLQARLLEIRDLLSESNFRDWLRSYAEALEKSIIDHVIMEIRVDSKIGSEIQSQLSLALPRLFHSLGLYDSVYFQKLNQCLTVYALNAGGCILLKGAVQDHTENVIENILAEMGLSLLTHSEIEALLQRRSDIVMT